MSRSARRLGRGEQLDRALRLVVAFHNRPQVGLTVGELGELLECSRRSVYRWLDAAILTLPIARVPDSYPVRYRLLTVRRERAA